MRFVLPGTMVLCLMLITSISGCISCPFTNTVTYATPTPTPTPTATATTPPPPPPPMTQPTVTAMPTATPTPTTTPTPTPVPTSTPTPTPTPTPKATSTPTPTPTPKPTQLSTPGLVSPSVNQTMGTPPKNVSFSWRAVSNTNSYKLEVEENVSGWVSRVNVRVTGTMYNKSIGFGSTQWRWRVTALGTGAYTDSAPSQWRYFSFASAVR